jgi:hypothetical protein
MQTTKHQFIAPQEPGLATCGQPNTPLALRLFNSTPKNSILVHVHQSYVTCACAGQLDEESESL